MEPEAVQAHQAEITHVRRQLETLRRAVDDMDELLNRYSVAEAALRRSEEQLRLLVSSVREYAIFTLDPDGFIASWNTGAQLIKGYTAAESIGQHFSIFYPAADIAARKPERALESARRDGVYQEEGWRIRKDGTRFWATVVITALYDDQGTLHGFGKVTRDLTERKTAEEAQQRMNEQALELTREQAAREQAQADLRQRDIFLTATAHELRTPITTLMGYAQLLQRRVSQGELTPERIVRPVQAIAQQVLRLDRLTTMVLDSTRLEHGTVVLERVALDLRPLVESVLQELQMLTEHHGFALDLPAEPVMVVGDALRLEHVVSNLVSNAIKYSHPNGTIRVTLRRVGAEAVLSVADSGIGIPAEEQAAVFERFFRATNVAPDSRSGLGLGLYLVKEFVELHGGTVAVESAVGQGTTVRVALPGVAEPGAAP